MKGACNVRRSLAICACVLGFAALATPVFAQAGVKGKVVDANKQPVPDAKVTIEMVEGMNRKFEVKTNKRGEFIQIGLQPGQYKVTAEKDGEGVRHYTSRQARARTLAGSLRRR